MYSISSPAGLLSTIPVHLGRYPADSVVAMTIEGKRVGATLRIDKPAVMDAAWIDTFISYLAKAPCDQVVLAAFAPTVGGTDPHYEAEMQQLAARITSELPVTIMMMALVTPDYWLDYADGDRRPALELEASSVLMEMVANGDADKHVHTIPGTIHDPEFTAAVEARSGTLGEFGAHRLYDLWNSLLSTGTLPDGPEAQRIVAAFEGGALRDGLICRVFVDTVEEPDYPAILLGTGTAPFDRARFDHGLVLINHLLTLDAPARHRASLLAAAGWMHWHAGRGTAAIEHFDEGLALVQDHRLCDLLRQFVNGGRLSPIAGVKSNWINN